VPANSPTFKQPACVMDGDNDVARLPSPSGSDPTSSPPLHFQDVRTPDAASAWAKDQHVALLHPFRGSSRLRKLGISGGSMFHSRLHSQRWLPASSNRSGGTQRFARPLPLIGRTALRNTARSGFDAKRCTCARLYGDLATVRGGWQMDCVSRDGTQAPSSRIISDRARAATASRPKPRSIIVHVQRNSPKVPQIRAVGLCVDP